MTIRRSVICKQYGADLMYDSSSEGLIRDAIKSRKKLDILIMSVNRDQMFSGDEEAMAMSAKM
jgi:hypothetical protein